MTEFASIIERAKNEATEKIKALKEQEEDMKAQAQIKAEAIRKAVREIKS